MGFWSSLWGGSDPNLDKAISATGNIAGYATDIGEKNLTAGSQFLRDVLSGDSSKTMQALAPTISAAKKSAQEQNKTTAEFGTRSGGTAASTMATNDKVHAEITNLLGELTGTAASGLVSSGGSLVNTGLAGYEEEANLSSQRIQNWENSIFGRAITGAVSGAESLALG